MINNTDLTTWNYTTSRGVIRVDWSLDSNVGRQRTTWLRCEPKSAQSPKVRSWPQADR